MKTNYLLYNGVIYTQADKMKVDSIAVRKNRIVAIGNNLQHDPDFAKYEKIDLKKKTLIPGLVDAHTHFYFFALSLGRVSLDGIESIDACLKKINNFRKKLKKTDWITGEGYSPDRFKVRTEPTKEMLDSVSGNHPAFFYSKDQHAAWVNTKALALAKITHKTKDPVGGKIDRDADGNPTGILRENAIGLVYDLLPQPSPALVNRYFKEALEYAYKNGVTGVHSFDGSIGYDYMKSLADKNKLGLRVNYYFPADEIKDVAARKLYYGSGDDFLRVAGVKIFSDGSLGSQTALCYNKYIGTKDNYGLETKSVKRMSKNIKDALKLGLPSAIHAIGDKAVTNVLDALEGQVTPHFGARHRIEHLQLVRRKDIKQIKEMNITASMQPSHCPSDIHMMRKYWGARSKNAFIFNTLQKKKIPLAFGSDVPIEPLQPLHGIAAAVRRARQKSNDVFFKEEKLTAADALYHYTVGPAYAAGQEHCRGYLLPGYPADMVLLDRDITTVAASKIYETEVLATVLDGKLKYGSLS